MFVCLFLFLFCFFFFFCPLLLCFAFLSFFSFLVRFLLLLFSFCTKLSQCISSLPIPFFPSAQAISYASSTGLIGSPQTKKLPQKSTRRNLIKESFGANRVGGGGMKSGRAVGCFRDRIESPKWKQRMEVEKVGLVPVAVFLIFWLAIYITYSQKMLYYYYYFYYY